MLPRRRTTMPPFEVMGQPSAKTPGPRAEGAATPSTPANAASGAVSPGASIDPSATETSAPIEPASSNADASGAVAGSPLATRGTAHSPPHVMSRAPRERTIGAPGMGVGRPLLVRIAPGWLVLAALALLMLLIAAYWVGKARGYEKRLAEDREQEQVPRQLPPAPPAVTGGSLRDAMGGAGNSGLGSAASGRGSPETPGNPAITAQREIGRNYLILATYTDRAEAQRLSAYLRKHAVEAAVVSGNNGRLFVVDLMGFDAAEMRQRNGAYDQRKAQLRKLGRTWRDQEKGPTDLSDMWPEKFTGEKSAATPPSNSTATPTGKTPPTGKKRESP